ncbi:MAG TPA: transcriptional activator RfaH [Verrucomicrobiae bacterium]
MQAITPAWYSVRTKPKHEHIASANLQRHLELPVFYPRIRLEKMTRRGLVRVVEPLFPCYLFVRCIVEERDVDIQHVSGVSRLVKFGHKYPPVADAVIEDLQSCFGASELIAVESHLAPGDEVTVASGAFAGMSAQVLKNLPAKKRVQLLLDILGRPTTVEVERDVVMPKHNALSDLAPFLAAPAPHDALRV